MKLASIIFKLYSTHQKQIINYKYDRARHHLDSLRLEKSYIKILSNKYVMSRDNI